MSNGRRETLQQLLAQDPSNALARYGLAMDFVNSGELEPAIAEFEMLLGTKPDYSAAYFHGGQTLEKLGRIDDARDWYRRGVAVARDPHQRSELQAALDILGE